MVDIIDDSRSPIGAPTEPPTRRRFLTMAAGGLATVAVGAAVAGDVYADRSGVFSSGRRPGLATWDALPDRPSHRCRVRPIDPIRRDLRQPVTRRSDVRPARRGRTALSAGAAPAHRGQVTVAASPVRPVSRAVLVRAVERALRAPSVHNTQPWKWRLGDGEVRLYGDRDRQLVGTDPDRRDLVISCGAALHHLRVALADVGVATTTERLPDPEDSTLLALVHTTDGPADPRDAALAAAIERRHSDRRGLRPEPTRREDFGVLAEHAAAWHAGLHPVVGDDARGRLDAVLGEAATLEPDAPGHAAELALWTSRYGGGRDGIPRGSLPARGAGDDSPGLRRFPSGRLSQPPQHLNTGPDGSTLMVLTTSGDGVLDWLRAGEATSAVLLAATLLGLATTALSQAVEVADTRRKLADTVLRVPEHAQLVLRVGRAPADAAPLPPTPRRPLHSVLLPD